MLIGETLAGVDFHGDSPLEIAPIDTEGLLHVI